MSKIRILAMSVSIIALTACSHVPLSQSELPKPIDLASSWTALIQKTDSDAYKDDVRAGWLYGLKMEGLNLFIEDVLKNSPNIKIVAHRMVAAGYDARSAGASLYPSLNASFKSSKTHTGGVTGPFNHALGLDASWEIDVWGRISDSKAAANSTYEEAINDLEFAKLSLVSQAAQAWFDAIAAHQQMELAQRTVVSYERTYRIVHNRYKRGLIKGLDLRQAISVLEESKSTLSFRQAELSRIKRQLETLSGHYPAAAIKVSGELPLKLMEIPVGLPSEILERRPDLRAAKARLFNVDYKASAAHKNLLPSFSITASGNNSSEFFGDLLKFDNVFWNLIGNITQPIFRGGQLKNTALASDARFEAEKQTFAKTLLTAFREVENGLENDFSYKDRVHHTAKAAENAMIAEQVALDQYSRGLITISEVLQNHRQSLQQQGQLISIKNEQINNRIRLHLALGGGFGEKVNSEETPQGDKL